MRSTVLGLLTLLLLVHVARADDTTIDLRLHVAAPYPLPFRPELERKAHDAVVLRNVGIITTVAGSVVTTIGAVVGGMFISVDNSPAREGTAAIALIGAGQAAVLAGIPMWVVGGVREKRARVALSLTACGVVGRF